MPMWWGNEISCGPLARDDQIYNSVGEWFYVQRFEKDRVFNVYTWDFPFA